MKSVSTFSYYDIHSFDIVFCLKQTKLFHKTLMNLPPCSSSCRVILQLYKTLMNLPPLPQVLPSRRDPVGRRAPRCRRRGTHPPHPRPTSRSLRPRRQPAQETTFVSLSIQRMSPLGYNMAHKKYHLLISRDGFGDFEIARLMLDSPSFKLQGDFRADIQNIWPVGQMCGPQKLSVRPAKPKKMCIQLVCLIKTPFEWVKTY